MAHGVRQPQSRRVLQRLPQRQLGEEDVLLEDVADLPLPALAEGIAVEENLAGVELEAAAEAVEEGGLPAAGGAHDGEHLAGADEAVHVLEDLPAAGGDADAAEGEVDGQGPVIRYEAWEVYRRVYPGKKM